MLKNILVILATFVFLLVILNIIKIILKRKEESLLKEGREDIVHMFPLFKKLIKIGLFIPFLLFLLQNLGVDIGALLAGLGLGGLLIALAGQKTVENLFGGIMLLLDQPVKVGDYCRFSGFTGRVEYIGLRSTRLRTHERTVLTIPNGEFSQCKIENLAKRDNRLFLSNIKLSLDNEEDVLKSALFNIKNHLLYHEKIKKDDINVHLSSFMEDAINLEISIYLAVKNTHEFNILKEELIFTIMNILRKEKVIIYDSEKCKK